VERRAAVGVVCGPEFSLMRRNDATANRKAEAPQYHVSPLGEHLAIPGISTNDRERFVAFRSACG
jgi:hypothetical protein